MNFYILPALVALLAKLFVLVVARRSGIRTDYLYALIATFAAHNICELVGISNYTQTNGLTIYIGRAYYATSFALSAIAYSCALQVSETTKHDVLNIVAKIVWVAAGIGIVLSLFTNYVVAGVAELSYSPTAIKGNAYWVFQLTVAVAMLASAIALIKGVFVAQNKKQKVRCLSMLIAYIPLIAAWLMVISLMTAGFKINGAGLIPIATTLFICILVYSERRHHLTDIRRVVPGTQENKVAQELQEVFAKYAAGEIGHQDSTNKIELLLLAYSYDKHNGNVLQTAKFMQVGRSTLYKKMQKYNLGRQRKTTDEDSEDAAVKG